MLDKVLNKIKMIIGIEKLYNAKIETDEKLPDDVALKNVVILVASLLKMIKKSSTNIFRKSISSIKH